MFVEPTSFKGLFQYAPDSNSYGLYGVGFSVAELVYEVFIGSSVYTVTC